jgi:hypothetical protein
MPCATRLFGPGLLTLTGLQVRSSSRMSGRSPARAASRSALRGVAGEMTQSPMGRAKEHNTARTDNWGDCSYADAPSD